MAVGSCHVAIFHRISSNIVNGQIHVTLCLTYLLNNKNYNNVFPDHRFLWTMTRKVTEHYTLVNQHKFLQKPKTSNELSGFI